MSIIEQQQATNAEMMINFKTANMLGLPVPQPLLGSADEGDRMRRNLLRCLSPEVAVRPEGADH